MICFINSIVSIIVQYLHPVSNANCDQDAEVSEALKARNYCRVGDAKIRNRRISCALATRRQPRDNEHTVISTEDRMRRHGLRWEYKWVTQEELDIFRAEKAENDLIDQVIIAATEVPVNPSNGSSSDSADTRSSGGGLVAYDSDSDEGTNGSTRDSGTMNPLNGTADGPKRHVETEQEFDDGSDDSDDESRQPPPGPPPKVYGPFPTQTMIEWQDQNFFATGLVLVRQEGEVEWEEITELDLSLFP